MSAPLLPWPPPKQIRFINNPGQPPSKRRRIASACLTCRKRKTRCAGERPTCSSCQKNGHDCLGYADITEEKKDYGGNAASDSGAGPYDAAQREDIVETDAKGDEDIICHDRAGNSRPHLWQANQSSAEQYRRHEQPRDGHKNVHHQHGDYRRSVSFHDSSHGGSIASQGGHASSRLSPFHQQHPYQHHTESHRVPYFRYFGPTAIVPGYKQMVVDVSSRDRRRSHGSSLSTSTPNAILTEKHLNYFQSQQNRQGQGSLDTPFDNLTELPVYDPSGSAHVHPVLINLIKTFFIHLGCNYPFLCEQRVMRKLRDRHMEPILVDAMCALAARFSDLPVFTNGNDAGEERDGRVACSEYGHFYAQRAKAATVDTFPCPSVAAVQACLLMAYEGFGADQDSALWMYLGIAIRMAVDLGLQKKIPVDTTQSGKDPWLLRSWNTKSGGSDREREAEDGDMDPASKGQLDGSHDGRLDGQKMDMGTDSEYRRRVEEPSADDIRAEEQERADTFWAVFFLDRVISSGTGRPVTFRDDDFDLAFPETALDPVTQRPAPFPVLAQIIHLYGRVSDVLNNIRNVDDLTQEKMKRLAQMESDLTQLYQRQDPRLNFNAPNFQAYVRAGQGTTFILLHFWFHALIIVLHQPTLLTPFGSLHRRHQLLPNSHELSMSSAKTIADILAFAELIDPKSFIGNPFTSQPMYIAACAFLAESISNASLGASSPHPHDPTQRPQRPDENKSAGIYGTSDAKSAAKHSLLASSANQNYQRCYKSLQQLHLYWGGVRYILSALDQKSKGTWDCETFTSEELKITRNIRDESLGSIPGFNVPGSPKAPPIAWSLTGTSNSANPSLTVLFQSHQNASGHAKPSGQPHLAQPHHPQEQQGKAQQEPQQPQQHTARLQLEQDSGSFATPPGNMVYDPIRQSLPEASSIYSPTALHQANLSAVRFSPQITDQQSQVLDQQQGQAQYQQHSTTYTSNTTAGQARQAYKDEQGRHGIPGSPCPGAASDGQQASLFGSTDAAYQRQYRQRQHQNPQQQELDQHQRRYVQSDVGQGQIQQTLPAQIQSLSTPLSHESSYDGGRSLPGTSPAGNSIGGFGPGVASMGHLDGSGLGSGGDGDYVANANSYLEMGPIADVITYDSQEVDISQLTDIMPQWLEYLPSNVIELFDENGNNFVGTDP